jgi:hypothetical protein
MDFDCSIETGHSFCKPPRLGLNETLTTVTLFVICIMIRDCGLQPSTSLNQILDISNLPT